MIDSTAHQNMVRVYENKAGLVVQSANRTTQQHARRHGIKPQKGGPDRVPTPSYV